MNGATPAAPRAEIQDLQDLRAEAAELEAQAEQIHALRAEFERRTRALPEKLGAAPFGTRSIAQAVTAVEDATGIDDALAALATVRQAVDQADALAETAAALQATGDIAAYTGASTAGPATGPVPAGPRVPPPATPGDPMDPAPTDQQRFDAVFTALRAAGVAVTFNLRGATGVREDRHHDYVRAAYYAHTDRWVGAHVGNVDTGGGHWADGKLHYGRRPSDNRVREVLFSFNHERPELARMLVRLFRAQGITARWTGDVSKCVTVKLDTARRQKTPTAAAQYAAAERHR